MIEIKFTADEFVNGYKKVLELTVESYRAEVETYNTATMSVKGITLAVETTLSTLEIYGIANNVQIKEIMEKITGLKKIGLIALDKIKEERELGNVQRKP